MVSTLPVKGNALWRYWTSGKGLARWRDKPHPWTALHNALLKEGVPAHMAAGLATNIYHAVTGKYPEHKKKGRSSEMTEVRTAEVLEVRTTDDGLHVADIRIMKYGVVDSYKTRFMPGVFTRSIEDDDVVAACWAHDGTRPIGTVSDFRDSAEHLDATLTFLDFEAVPDARMAHETVKSGAIKGVSVGFERKKVSPSAEHRDVTDFIEARMVEVSLVLNPAVPGAKVLSVRNESDAAADIITRFAAGQIDLTDALVELRSVKAEATPERKAEFEFRALDGASTADPKAILSSVDSGLNELAKTLDKDGLEQAQKYFRQAASRLSELMYLFDMTPAVEGWLDHYAAPDAETREEDADADGVVEDSIEETREDDAEFEELPEDFVGTSDEDDARAELDAVLGRNKLIKKPYGDVNYADPGYQKDTKKRYPLNTKDRVIAAWRYVNMPGHSKKYSASQLKAIKGRIKSAARKYGVKISAD